LADIVYDNTRTNTGKFFFHAMNRVAIFLLSTIIVALLVSLGFSANSLANQRNTIVAADDDAAARVSGQCFFKNYAVVNVSDGSKLALMFGATDNAECGNETTLQYHLAIPIANACNDTMVALYVRDAFYNAGLFRCVVDKCKTFRPDYQTPRKDDNTLLITTVATEGAVLLLVATVLAITIARHRRSSRNSGATATAEERQRIVN
jgi:hypothetical protein